MKLEIKKGLRQAMGQTPSQQESLQVLQMPAIELGQWLLEKIEQNPLLQYAESRGKPLKGENAAELDFEISRFEVLEELDISFSQAVFDQEEAPDFQASSCPTLHDHLMQQAREIFSSKEELEKAEEIIGSLDSRGFLGDTPADPVILAAIQSFDPPGIAARDLRQSLLLQLSAQGKKESSLYALIENNFKEFLKRPLDSSEIKEIASCNLSPAEQFSRADNQPLIPDVILKKASDTWIVEMNETPLPQFCLQTYPLQNCSSEDLAFVRRQMQEGKRLLKALLRRKETLEKIVRYLVEKQPHFFQEGQSKLLPLSMGEMARDLQLCPSTITRAVSSKVLACPGGVFPLRFFFSSSLSLKSGRKISRTTALDLLKKLVETEERSNPLSDEEIALKLLEKGILCARRTIAKYRSLLKIPPAPFRKNWRKKISSL